MRFRGYQQKARRISGGLLCLYVLAVTAVAGAAACAAALVFSFYILPPSEGAGAGYHKAVFISVFVSVTAVIAGAGWVRMRQLSAGGHVVAEALGGVRVTRSNAGLAERRLLNVVEEMALASGVRMPKVYVLPDSSLNAFAAGMSENDAVIGITRGAVRGFDRNELQAVVAHEFSHILNGDMRRNMQLCGCLYGLQMITGLGRFFMYGDTGQSVRSAESRGLPTVFLGAVLVCFGFAGSLAASWIQAAISRQREFLADASAVQFTRQSDGLASALYKVAVASHRKLASPYAAEYAHFMFEGVHEADIFDKLAATHPDIYVRIERLSPFKARRWKKEILAAQAVRTDFFFTSSAAYFSDGHGDFSAAEAESRQKHLSRQTAEAIRAFDSESADRAAELARLAPRHWLSAEGDGERLFVVLALLFAPQAAERAAQEWETGLPLRAAFYRRLSRRPLPEAVHRAVLEHLLPTAAALPQHEHERLHSGLYALIQNETLSPAAALLWLEAAGRLAWFKPVSDGLPQQQTDAAVIRAVREWVAQGGRLNHETARSLPHALHTAAALDRRERLRLCAECCRILADGTEGDWPARAQAVVKLYCR